MPINKNARTAQLRGYRKPSDYQHMSVNAQFRLLYTKRKIHNEKERRILQKAQSCNSHKWLFMYYSGGVSAFMALAAFGQLGLILGIIGASYVFYRYVHMTWSFSDRLTYESEYPVKSITKIHQELVQDGLKLSMYSIALTLLTIIMLYSMY